MKDILSSAQKILVLLPKEINFDILSAAIGFSLCYQEKEIQYGFPAEFPEAYTSQFPEQKYKLIKEIKKPEVVISLNRKKGIVDAVRWREEEDKIQFIITPKKGNLEFNDVDLSTIGADYDAVVAVGCSTYEDAGDIYTSNPDFFETTQVINIDNNPKNVSYGVVNEIGATKSLSEWMLDLLSKQGVSISEDAAAVLFKGALWTNEGFREKGDLTNVIAKVMSAGGDITQVIPEVYNTLSVAQARYMGKMLAGINITSENVVISKVLKSDIQGVKTEEILYPEINVLSRIEPYSFAVILTEVDEQNVAARVYSREKDSDLLEIFAEFSPRGSKSMVSFSSEGTLDDLEASIKARLPKQTEVSQGDVETISDDPSESPEDGSIETSDDKSPDEGVEEGIPENTTESEDADNDNSKQEATDNVKKK